LSPCEGYKGGESVGGRKGGKEKEKRKKFLNSQDTQR